MKKYVLLVVFVLACAATAFAGDGSTCDNAIEVDTAYSGSFSAGEYWFTATTASLPLTLYFYPEDTAAKAPDIYMDLTCTPGVYDDPVVADMVATAGDYNLSFPMHEVPHKELDDDGIVRYTITYDRNYRDMLYNHGVTNAIAAYVRFVCYTQGNVYIVSKSINSRCRDYVVPFGMDVSLTIAPGDSVKVNLWPIGEWINKNYRITWESPTNGKLDFYDGTDCVLSRTQRVRDHFILPQDTIIMNRRRASDWINDIYQTELYVRLFAEAEGTLHIQSYEEKTRLLEFVVAGIQAVIDNDNMTVTAVLPKGTNRKTAILRAKSEGTIKYVAYNGETIVFDNQCATMKLGSLVYNLGGISVAKDEGSTDATLQTVLIDGDTLLAFAPNTAVYDDVETASAAPVLSVVTTDTAAACTIKQAASVPGTATATVKAEAGNTQVYTFNFIRQRSHNTYLSAIFVDGEPLQDFEPATRHYRAYVSGVPCVTAVAADPLSTVVIEQANSIQGYARIYVTAEAGNTDIYTVNFAIDPRILQCAESATDMTLGTAVDIHSDADEVLRMPLGRSLESDSANWSGQRISLLWSGRNSNLRLYIGTTCIFDPALHDKMLIDSIDIVPQKGENRRIVYLTEEQTRELGKHSIDGYLYLRFEAAEDGTLKAENWTPDCMNTSTLIDINSDTYLPQNHDVKNTYKLYLPDWKDKQVTFTWEGSDKMDMYMSHLNKCEFQLKTSQWEGIERAVIEAGDSLVWTPQNIKQITNKCYLGDFLYVRFWTDNREGTLHVRQTGGKQPVYTITWFDDAGVKIDTTMVEKDKMPQHAVPVKPDNAEYTYTFYGWQPAIVPATSDAAYRAVFTATKNRYAAVFRNYDGTVLQTDSLEYGNVPLYRGAVPQKAANAHYTYVFAGWTPAIDSVRANTEYVAQFDSIVNRYLVRFLDEDGTPMKTDSVEYGIIPLAPADPEKPDTEQYHYAFSAWQPAIAPVVADADYTATYTATLRSYTVQFLNENDSIISTQTCDYGTMPVLPADTLKPATARYTYIFKGWTPEVGIVTGNITYTAAYDSIVNNYRIVFYSADGNTVLQVDSLEYGSMPQYRGAVPQKTATAEYTYTFVGWTPALAFVISDAEYKAVFDSVRNRYQVVFRDEDNTLLQTDTLEYGIMPQYRGATPQKVSTPQYSYAFHKWTPDITQVTADAVYTAAYTPTLRSYTVTWIIRDSVVASDVLPYGVETSAPVAVGTTYEAVDSIYTLTGWEPEPAATVTGDATYTAVLEVSAHQYLITFLDEDGTTLCAGHWDYGAMPECDEPEKAEDEQYTYAFSGWQPEVTIVMAEATYTATYTATAKTDGLDDLQYSGIVREGGVLHNTNGTRLCLYDVVGRLVLTTNGDIDLHSLQRGLYLLNLPSCGNRTIRIYCR